jgi:hypothetical protein
MIAGKRRWRGAAAVREKTMKTPGLVLADANSRNPPIH